MAAPPLRPIRDAVRLALREDLADGDATTTALFPSPIVARAHIVAEQRLVAAGIAVARAVFTAVDKRLRVVRAVRDGAQVGVGARVMTVEGDARSLLMAERTALNFLQRLSGIATLTARYCEAVRGSRVLILDTRKTTPGLRALEKWAVRLGGGANHRMSLGDGLLIKDNHLALWRASPGQGPAEACRRARRVAPRRLPLVVEAKTLQEVREALAGQPDIILLDNMKVRTIRKAVALIDGRALVEVSGGVTLDNVRAIAAAGPDRISIGALTHSAPAANVSMDLIPLKTVRATTGRSRS